MRAWQAFSLLALLAASPAHANGAMSLALTIFEWRTWLLYVAATLVFEAWALGKLLRVPLGRSIGVSLVANLLTGLLGASCLGMVAYGAPENRLNPNPFGHTLTVFLVYGLLSALVEANFWASASPLIMSWRQLAQRSIVVHLLGVPLGLAILLAPARPYRGLEMQVGTNRQLGFHHRDLAKALEKYVTRHGRLPPARSYAEMLEMVRSDLGEVGKWPDLWASAYQPVYHRFDTGEARRGPMIEWNAALAADRRPAERLPATVWVIRKKYPDGYYGGLTWTPYTVIFKWVYRPALLGYGASSEDATTPSASPAAR
jgi:hypothetical protein